MYNLLLLLINLVPGEGIEPPTNGLQNRCSTAELTRQVGGVFRGFRYELPPDGPPTDCAREASSIGHDVERDAPRRAACTAWSSKRGARPSARQAGGEEAPFEFSRMGADVRDGHFAVCGRCACRCLAALGVKRVAERGIARRTRRGPLALEKVGAPA